MKKLISVILCIVLLLSLCSCGKEATASDEGYGTVTVEPVEPVDTHETEPEPTPEPTPEALSAVSYTGDFSGYRRIMPTAANASSALNFMGKIFFPEYAADGDISTCWQEGAAGAGAGESIMISFGREISADLLRLRLGHAKDDNSYYMNARPASLLIEFSGGESMVYDFPDTNEWHTIELSAAVKCEWVKLTIKSVYGGDEYEDNCIAEIAVYSESPGEGAETGYYGGLAIPVESTQAEATTTENGSAPGSAGIEPYVSYISILEDNSWATDFGIDLEDNPSMEGMTIREMWYMSWEDYLVSYPVKYTVFDTNGDGVDELMICGDSTIGIIDHCYFFTWNGTEVVYMGKVCMRPDCVYKDGDGFILIHGVSMNVLECGLRFENGVPIEGEYVNYGAEDNCWPEDRGLELVAVCHERNEYPFPNLVPLMELAYK